MGRKLAGSIVAPRNELRDWPSNITSITEVVGKHPRFIASARTRGMRQRQTNAHAQIAVLTMPWAPRRE